MTLETPGDGADSASRLLDGLVADFLGDVAHGNRSAHTHRAYATDLASFAHLAPATRARKEAALASFLAWAYRHDLIPADPMGKLDRVRLEPPTPRGLPPSEVEAILAGIPFDRRRDRLLCRLVAELGLRAGEALSLYVEDIDLTPDDEHVSVLGKGGRRRTVLLDNDRLVAQLRAYLRQPGYQHGPLFRAEKNGWGGPLRYKSAQEHSARDCAAAGVDATLHQLHHTHATELVNAGVSLATIRKRLGHRNLQTTTLRYAEQSDAAADAEMRPGDGELPGSGLRETEVAQAYPLVLRPILPEPRGGARSSCSAAIRSMTASSKRSEAATLAIEPYVTGSGR
jgi:integrase/recombinase XerD